jgi:hypothetical protein
LALGDWDGDGIVDLAVTSTSAGRLTTRRGQRTGDFDPQESIVDVLSSPVALLGADFTGDRVLDLFAVSSAGPSPALTLYRNSGSGSFAAVLPAPIASGCIASAAVAVDLDRDSRPDVVLSCLDGSLRVLLATGAGQFTNGSASIGLVAAANVLVSGDFDGDHNLDIVAGVQSKNLYLLRGDGLGGLGPPLALLPGGTLSFGAVKLTSGDFDGDGKPDLATANDHLLLLFNSSR